MSDIYDVCFHALLPFVGATIVQEGLSKDMNINGSGQVVATGRKYVSAMDRIQARRNRLIWDPFARLPAMKLFWGILCTSCRTV